MIPDLWPLWGALLTLYLISEKFRFYVKIVGFYSILCWAPLICLPFALLTPCSARNVIYPAYVGKFVTWLYGISWTVHGKENVKNLKGTRIIVSNHQTTLDCLGMTQVYPLMHPATIVMKKELLYYGLFGLYSWLSACVFIDRKRSDEAKRTLNEKLEHVKRNKWNLWVFPEGTRNPTGEMLPFKKGAFYIAIESQIPIIPVVYDSHVEVYDARKKYFKTGHLNAYILPPIHTKGLTTKDVGRIAEQVRQDMMKVLEKSQKMRQIQSGTHTSDVQEIETNVRGQIRASADENSNSIGRDL